MPPSRPGPVAPPLGSQPRTWTCGVSRTRHAWSKADDVSPRATLLPSATWRRPQARRRRERASASRMATVTSAPVVYPWSTKRRNAGNLRLIVEQPKFLICRGSVVYLTLARPAFTFPFRTENRGVASSILALAIHLVCMTFVGPASARRPRGATRPWVGETGLVRWGASPRFSGSKAGGSFTADRAGSAT